MRVFYRTLSDTNTLCTLYIVCRVREYTAHYMSPTYDIRHTILSNGDCIIGSQNYTQNIDALTHTPV